MTTLEIIIAVTVIWLGLACLVIAFFHLIAPLNSVDSDEDEREAQHYLYGQRPRLGIDRVEHLGGKR